MILPFLLHFLQLLNPTVELQINIESSVSEGKVFYAVFDNADTFMKNGIYESDQKLEGKKTVIYIELPPGDYAISFFHDTNGNGELDTNLFGIPTEPYGFSKNARGMFGPPNFNQCLFTLDSTTKPMNIKLY